MKQMAENRIKRDYSLTGRDALTADAAGLVSAEWYHTHIPRKTMKDLMRRYDGPALRDTAIWILFLLGLGAGGVFFWGTVWCVPFFIAYGVLYGSSGDSRWHECGHGTAFRTTWMNTAIYHIASFMMFREPTIWRWSHARHHTDTIIVGRDPEIAIMRPPNIAGIFLDFFAVRSTLNTLKHLIIHAAGRLTGEEKTFVPEMERWKVFAIARLILGIHVSVLVLAFELESWPLVMLIGILPTMYGAWLGHIFAMTQHAGLAENVLDHRLNSRTVHMNAVSRFIYWNMNYHVEHHMFPMVPYHALPKLHDMVLDDMPKPYGSTLEVFLEIIPALLKQRKDPDWHVRRELPSSAKFYRPEFHGQNAPAVGHLP